MRTHAGADSRIVEVLREAAPQVLATIVSRYRQFEACEDAVQEALLAATIQWPDQGIPDNPRAWLTTVATRRLADQWHSDQARRRREATVVALGTPTELEAPGPDEGPPDRDDTLMLLFLCCHPDLSPSSQMALTLRAFGGLSTAEIARALLTPESTVAQRISRAKQRIRSVGIQYPLSGEMYTSRLRVVLHMLYLIFNEGYASTSGPDLLRSELTREAIRLTRTVYGLLPDDGEVAGLLALMLLTEARSQARTAPDGTLIPLTEQDRSRWSQHVIHEGIALITRALASGGPVGQYQLQAAIAAVHAEAARPQDTDWRQISALYELLEKTAPNPMITLSRAVAVAMVRGPEEGLALLAPLDRDKRMRDHHRFHAVRGHLLEMAGDLNAARHCYQVAARRTNSVPEQRYLAGRSAGLGGSTSR
ncbi:RNA polymerase, sigma subunit, ECF family [Micromonospora peucetia]|uniref:RNA polymerase, sigma subunit, ECF family n=1 Tax=Micromonospora peucetia TaxID=47871 RepID=A0A1C6VUY7_9ACTN|nr:RNA polymerase, sigma subunit, ECF family [Micromonospora peucetia]